MVNRNLDLTLGVASTKIQLIGSNTSTPSIKKVKHKEYVKAFVLFNCLISGIRGLGKKVRKVRKRESRESGTRKTLHDWHQRTPVLAVPITVSCPKTEGLYT